MDQKFSNVHEVPSNHSVISCDNREFGVSILKVHHWNDFCPQFRRKNLKIQQSPAAEKQIILKNVYNKKVNEIKI